MARGVSPSDITIMQQPLVLESNSSFYPMPWSYTSCAMVDRTTENTSMTSDRPNQAHYRLHKPVPGWLETLPDIRTEYVREIPLVIIEMERIDLWLNVKGNYIFL